jgi:hypothetical protein
MPGNFNDNLKSITEYIGSLGVSAADLKVKALRLFSAFLLFVLIVVFVVIIIDYCFCCYGSLGVSMADLKVNALGLFSVFLLFVLILVVVVIVVVFVVIRDLSFFLRLKHM